MKLRAIPVPDNDPERLAEAKFLLRQAMDRLSRVADNEGPLAQDAEEIFEELQLVDTVLDKIAD